MIFLDTSYVIALADSRDQWHDRARNWSNATRGKLMTTEYVLWECVNYFSSPIDRPKAAAIARYLRTDWSVEFMMASPQLLDDGLQLHAARADKFLVVDGLHFVCADAAARHDSGVVGGSTF